MSIFALSEIFDLLELFSWMLSSAEYLRLENQFGHVLTQAVHTRQDMPGIFSPAFTWLFCIRTRVVGNLCSLLEVSNKTGTSRVGAISKAQKYSRNNYWNDFEKNIFFFQEKVFLK